MNNEPLKFPTGEFTHTELAQLNGKTNQQVWTRYQAAIKDGTIVSAGNRPSTGKGKPSKLWKVNPNPPVSVVVVPIPAPAAIAPTVPPAVVIPTEPVVVPAAAPVVITPSEPTPIAAVVPTEPAKLPEPTPAALPAVEPATAPAETLTVEVARIEPAPEVNAALTVTTPPVEHVVKDVRTLTEVCPICKQPLSAINDATGVMVWCGQPPEVCVSAENPMGHGKNEREAYEKLCEKFDRQPTRATS